MDILSLCKQIEDPRIDRKKEHSVEVIVYIAMAAVLCGAETWNEIEEFGRSRKEFFASRISSFCNTPSHDIFNRFFSILSPGYFERVSRCWMSEFCSKYEDVIAMMVRLFVMQANVPIQTLMVRKNLNFIWLVLWLLPMALH